MGNNCYSLNQLIGQSHRGLQEFSQHLLYVIAPLKEREQIQFDSGLCHRVVIERRVKIDKTRSRILVAKETLDTNRKSNLSQFTVFFYQNIDRRFSTINFVLIT